MLQFAPLAMTAISQLFKKPDTYQAQEIPSFASNAGLEYKKTHDFAYPSAADIENQKRIQESGMDVLGADAGKASTKPEEEKSWWGEQSNEDKLAWASAATKILGGLQAENARKEAALQAQRAASAQWGLNAMRSAGDAGDQWTTGRRRTMGLSSMAGI